MATSNINFRPADGPFYEHHRTITEDWASFAQNMNANIVGGCSAYMIELAVSWKQNGFSWLMRGYRKLHDVSTGLIPRRGVYFNQTTFECQAPFQLPEIAMRKRNLWNAIGWLFDKWGSVSSLPGYRITPSGSPLPQLAEKRSFFRAASELKLQGLSTVDARQLYVDFHVLLSSPARLEAITHELEELACDLRSIRH